MTSDFKRGAEAMREMAAKLIGAPRNYKLNDGKSDIPNAARAKAAELIRALPLPDETDPAGRPLSVHRATCAGCSWCSPEYAAARARETEPTARDVAALRRSLERAFKALRELELSATTNADKERAARVHLWLVESEELLAAEKGRG